MNKTLRTILAVLCLGVIVACATLIAMKLSGRARADLTQHKLYTLSDGTKSILAKLNQPVNLTLYYSRTSALRAPEGIRRFNNYFQYVRDLLSEYEQYSGGKVKLSVVDPRPWSEEEESALKEGIKRFQIDADNSFFFGLTARTELGKVKTVPFFDESRQRFLEYDISKLVSSITLRDKHKIGVLSSLPVLGDDMSPYMMQMMQMQGKQPTQPWAVTEALKEEYELVKAEVKDAAFPADLDFLWVIHPKELSPEQLFAIDQYVMKGGRTMIFTDPHSVVDQPARDPSNPYAAMGHNASSNLNVLLRKWGVEMEPKAIAVDTALGVKINSQQNRNPEKFPAYLLLTGESFNKEDSAAGGLANLRVLFAGALEEVKGTEAKVTPLLSTTATGGTWTPENPFELQMPNAKAIRDKMKARGKPVMLACRITGKLQSNYPDGYALKTDENKDKNKNPDAPEAKPEEKKTEEPKAETKDADAAKADDAKAEDKAENKDAAKADKAEAKPEDKKPGENRVAAAKETADGHVVVVADVDFVTDMLCYERTYFGLMAPFADNQSFVSNLLDTLSGSSDLIKVRSRGSFKREFSAVRKIEAQVDEDTARRVDAVNKEIEDFQQKLTTLAGSANDKNEAVIKSKALDERREIEGKIRAAQKELRKLQEGRRVQVEALKQKYENLNRLLAPAVVLGIAVLLGLYRFVRAKRYAAGRN